MTAPLGLRRSAAHVSAAPAAERGHGAVTDEKVTAASLDDARLVFVFGSPRSGTTWLGKILDSHPGVRYLHEPDIALPPRLDNFVSAPFTPAQMTEAQAIVAAWWERTTVRTTGTRPVMRKQGEGRARHGLRTAGVYGAKALHRAAHLPERWLPPLLDPMPRRVRAEGSPLTVMKTVNLLGRADLLMTALSGARCIYLVRHPGAQVASELRGIRRFGATTELSYGAVPYAPLAAAAGVDAAALAHMSPVEILAWKWTVFNDAAYTALQSLPRAQVLRYEDLNAAPVATARHAFAALGLPWSPAVADYIAFSQSGGAERRHYGLRREPEAAANRWRRELDAGDIARVRAIAGRAEVGARLFGL